MTIGERIKMRREELGMSQEELASRIGYKSRSSINKIELGHLNLRQVKIKAIADALRTTPEFIMGWNEHEQLLDQVNEIDPFVLSLMGDINRALDIQNMIDMNLPDVAAIKAEQLLKGLWKVSSSDAQQLAADYDRLDVLGRHTVRTVADMELQRVGISSADGKAPAPVVDISTVHQTSGGFATLHVYDQPAAAGLGNYIDEPTFHVEQYPEAMLPKGTCFGILISGDSMEPRIPNGSTVFVQYAAAIDPGEIGIFVLDGQTYCKQLVVDASARSVALHSINPSYSDMIVDSSRELRTIGRVLGWY